MQQPVLVTGGSGFIGANMVNALIRDGIPAVTLDVMGYAASPLTLAPLRDNPLHRLVRGSIGDTKLVATLLREVKPRAVLNFAAHTHVDRSIDEPEPFIETNIVGTFRLLETIRGYLAELPEAQRQSFRLVHISTDEVFGSIDHGTFTEDDRHRPSSPYSASKAAADSLAKAWHITYGLPVIVTTCTNNYGPYQFPEKLIPRLLIRALDGQSLPVYGDGLNRRNWLFVSDHVAALRRILDAGRPGQTYNIAGRTETANLELVRQLCAILDRLAPKSDGTAHADAIRFVTDRPGHDRRYALSGDKMERELGWSPTVPLQGGLETTVAWYLDNSKWWREILRGSYGLERLGLAATERQSHA
jgi:dTDP-glucose 4,6-dehydratase